MVCPETKSNPYSKDEKLHASQELQTVHQEIFGRALQLKAKRELSDYFSWRSTGQTKKSMRMMSSQDPPLC